MSNEDQQNQSTEFESETNIEEPPSLEETLEVLDKVFDQCFDGIDAVELLARAEIDLFTFISCVAWPIKSQNNSKRCAVTPERSLENLTELEVMHLSDVELNYYLEVEEIDCNRFLFEMIELIEYGALPKAFVC